MIAKKTFYVSSMNAILGHRHPVEALVAGRGKTPAEQEARTQQEVDQMIQTFSPCVTSAVRQQ